MKLKYLTTSAAMALVAACTQTNHPTLTVSVAPSASQLRGGDSISVTVVVTNVSDRTQTIDGKSCPQPFDVIDPNGNTVRTDEICSAEMRLVELAPGASYTYFRRWGAVTTTYNAGVTTRTPLAPGRYLLQTKVTGVGSGGSTEITIVP